jgi:hypothetical protein
MKLTIWRLGYACVVYLLPSFFLEKLARMVDMLSQSFGRAVQPTGDNRCLGTQANPVAHLHY